MIASEPAVQKGRHYLNELSDVTAIFLSTRIRKYLMGFGINSFKRPFLLMDLRDESSTRLLRSYCSQSQTNDSTILFNSQEFKLGHIFSHKFTQNALCHAYNNAHFLDFIELLIQNFGSTICFETITLDRRIFELTDEEKGQRISTTFSKAFNFYSTNLSPPQILLGIYRETQDEFLVVPQKDEVIFDEDLGFFLSFFSPKQGFGS